MDWSKHLTSSHTFIYNKYIIFINNLLLYDNFNFTVYILIKTNV